MSDAQRDGRPAEYMWRPLGKFRNCTTPQSLADPAAGVLSSKVANIGERLTGTQSEFFTRRNSVRGQKPPTILCNLPAQETAKHQVWLASGE